MKKADNINPSISQGYWAIYLSLIISFVICAITAALCKDTFMEICTFFIVFGSAFIISAYQIHRGANINNAFYKRFEINQELLLNIALAVLIFNDKGKIVSLDINKKMNLSGNLKDYLDKLFAALSVPYKVQKDVRDVLIAGNINDYRQDFGTYEYDGVFYDLVIKKLTGEEVSHTVVYLISSNNKAQQGKKHFKDAFVGFYELDSNMCMLTINKYFAKILGYRKDELLEGQRNIKTLIDFTEFTNQEVKNIEGAWQGFVTFTTKYNEKVNCFVAQKRLTGERGEIEGMIGYVVKLNDSSLMLKSRGLEKEWISYSWRSFFENTPYPFAMLDNNGVVIKANKAFNGMVLSNLIDKKFTSIFSEEGETTISNEIQEVIANSRAPRALRSVPYKNDTRKLDIYLSVIKDPENQTFGFMVRVNDNTHQMELEESLSRAQRMQTMGQLVGAVAHDFNNLLTAITGFCDILLLRHAMGDPSFVNIIQIKQSADRASNLVKRLLAFSRKQTLKLEAIHLREFFSDISTLIQRLVGTEVVVKKDIESNLWLVKFGVNKGSYVYYIQLM